MRLVRATPSSRTPGPSQNWTWPIDGPDRRRAVGHGPRAQDGGKGPDLGGLRVGREKTGALNRTLRGRFRADRRENGEINGLEASGQFLPGRDAEGRRGALSLGNGGAGTRGTDDSWSLRLRYGRGYRGTLTLPRGPGPWPTPPAGPATAAPTPALTAARAPRKLWPMPSTLTSAADGRNFHQGNGHFHGGQGQRPTTHPVNSACSDNSGTSVTGCNDNEEDRDLLDLRPHLLGVAAQGAQLLLRKVPCATSPLGLQEARSLDLGQNTRWHGVGQSPVSALESISKSAPGSIFKSPLERAWYRVCLPVSM